MLSPILKGFHDQVYVLTIPNADERRAEVLRQLGEGNFEFVNGVDKNDVTKSELIAGGIYDEELAMKLDPRSRKMNIGHICCSIGHRMIYEKFLGSGGERALIFEDDIVAFDVDEQDIVRAIENVPADSELIYWGWSGGRFRPALGVLQQMTFHVKHFLGRYKYDHKMIRNVYMRPFNDHFDIAAVNFLAHAYTVTRSAAETFIKWNTPICLNADHVLIEAALRDEVKAYVSKTKLFGQRSADPTDPVRSLTYGS